MNTGQGFSNPRSGLFWKFIRVVQHLHQSHMHPCAYLLENIPPLEDYKSTILVGWQQIRVWIGEPVQVIVASIGSQAHWFQWM
jgi:site-specific DNA-cytosine methylase